MLAQMRGVDAVGAYGAAWRLLELSLILPQSVCLALYPQLAAAADDTARLAGLGRAALRVLLAGSVPLAVGLTMLAPQVMAVLYGPEFTAAAPTLAVLVWTLIPYLWVRLHAYVLVAADRQRVDLALNVAMTVVNIGLNLVLIPIDGHRGAAIATLVTMLVYVGAQYGYLWRALPGRAAPLRIPLQPLLGGAAMALLLWWLRDHGLVTALVAAVALCAGALAVGGLTAGAATGKVFDVGRVLRQFGVARG
jgi:O-antigen/teichoic acid export membrane protein